MLGASHLVSLSSKLLYLASSSEGVTAKSETIDGKSSSATGLRPWGEAAATLALQVLEASCHGLQRIALMQTMTSRMV